MKPTTLRYVKSDYHLAKRQTKETMKKIINKLFERLGYVPKKHHVPKRIYEDLLETAENSQLLAEWYDIAVKDIHTGKVKYAIEERHSSFLVYYTTDNTEDYGVSYNIKEFPFDIRDKAFARICAEELCEKLNEKY